MADEFFIVAADNHGRPLFVDLFKNADDLESKLGIEIAGGFVGEKDLGLIDDGTGNRHPLLFSVGEVGRILPHFLMEIDHPESLEDPATDLFNRDAQDMKAEGHVVKDLFMEEQAEVLEDDAHRPAELIDLVVVEPKDIDAIDDNLAPGRQDLAKNDLEKGRFPGSARPGDEPKIASFDMEADIDEGPLALLVLFPNVVELYHR